MKERIEVFADSFKKTTECQFKKQDHFKKIINNDKA